MIVPREFLARFWAKVDTSAGWDKCWRWRGLHNPAGGNGTTQRPRMRAPKFYGRRTHVYVAPFMLAVVDGLTFKELEEVLDAGIKQACHKPICPHPWCINPTHLYWGTKDENIRDRFPLRRTHADQSTRRAS